MPSVVIGDNQVRIKDSYAPAPIIDLTLRSNGEEKVMVMDSLGQFVRAGIEAPTVAPVATINLVTPGLTQSKWIVYRYVYAATSRYPLVENAITAGGQISPRGNPSPPSVAINTPAAPSSVDLVLTKLPRLDVDRIWLYRTAYYDTQAEAEEASELGDMHYVASVVNDGSAGTISYNDATTIVTGNELIENDNFMSEQFALCVYADPFFYGFGNFEFEAPVSIDATGLVTLTNPWSISNQSGDKWYDGRNSQQVRLDGITQGGFDQYGTFYFKYLTSTTAQLCLDLQLLQNGAPSSTGTTTIHIKGPATNLYRSKPRNPFSWGDVTLVGDEAVPAPKVYKVGGGQGTAIAVLPVLSLLKVDTEGPNKTYVFNLKAQGTDNFELTKEEISSDYTASNHWAQFFSKTVQGNSLLWFIDNKFKVICQSDGASNQDISSKTFEAIRNLSNIASDRLFAHGVYEPTLQLSCMWLTREGSNVVNDIALLYHHPSDTWTTLDQWGVLCSAEFLDKETNRQMVLVGTDTGLIGRAFAPDRYHNWTNLLHTGTNGVAIDNVTLEFAGDIFAGDAIVKGYWMVFIAQAINPPDAANIFGFWNNRLIGYARVLSSSFSAGITTVIFDKFRDKDNLTINGLFEFGIEWADYRVDGFLEPIVCSFTKFYNFSAPLIKKKLTGCWLSMDNIGSYRGTVGPIGYVIPDYINTGQFSEGEDISSFRFTRENRPNNMFGSTLTRITPTLYTKDPIVFSDTLKSFRIKIVDITFTKSLVYDYALIVK